MLTPFLDTAIKSFVRIPPFKLRLSLRALLLFVTVVCFWLAYATSAARRQERAVLAIESCGGRVGYGHEHNSPPGPLWLRDLIGRHYFDTVDDVRFTGQKTVESNNRLADAAAQLGNLGRLRHVSLCGFEPSAAGFDLFAANLNTDELICGAMEISDREAAALASAKNLRKLGLNDVIISANGVAEFRKLTQLETFWLVCKHDEFGPDNKTYWFNIPKYKLGDEIVDTFIAMPCLKTLSLNFTLVTDQGIRKLSELHQLESFGIGSPNVTDAAIDDIVRLTNLRWLGIGGTKIGDKSLFKLQQLPKLKGLRLSSAVTNDGLPIVAQLKQLESLDLGGKQIDDDGLVHLSPMKKLRVLDLQSTGVTTDGPAVKALKNALPTCRIRQFYPSPSFFR